MGKEKDLIRIFLTEEGKLGVRCQTDTEDESNMALEGLCRLFDNVPDILDELLSYCNRKVQTKQFILSLNNSKLPS